MAVLSYISDALPGSHVTAEDLDAGKNWVGVERRDRKCCVNNVYVLGWMGGPLVLLWDQAPPGVRSYLERQRVLVIVWDDYEEPSYCIDRSALQELFPYREWNYGAVDPDAMSITDLVYATM